MNGIPTTGQQLRFMRLARRMSLEDLAKATGIHYTMLSRFETGRMIPRPDELAAIRAALNWSPTDDAALALLAGDTCPEATK